MPYNPGITARGELLGQSIGAAGQSIAQSYGQGLRLQEEQKRYDDVMKQRRRDRKELKRSLGMQAELIGMDKEDIDTMGLGELQGFVEGTKLQTSLEFQGLQLQQLQEDIEQTASGKKAIGQMQMYMEEQNLDPITAATTAASDQGLELGEAAKLLNLATTGQKLGLELQTIQQRGEELDIRKEGQDISRGTLGVQQEQIDLQRQAIALQKNPPQPQARDVKGAPGYKVIDMGGGRSQLVETEGAEEDTTKTGGFTQQQIGKILKNLRSLKKSGETVGSVSSKGIVEGDTWGFDTDLDELIQKYELMQEGSGQPDEADIRKQAAKAIAEGADEALVRQRMKEQYGIDL